MMLLFALVSDDVLGGLRLCLQNIFAGFNVFFLRFFLFFTQ